MKYKKLVRDKIPSIIEKNGETPITRILSDEEYKTELEKKLGEEHQEVLNATGKDRIEELADMIEVIKYLAKVEGGTFTEVLEKAKKKASERGSFEQKIYLENVVKE